MSDALALAALLLLCVLFAAITSGDPLAWLREEWRRMRADTFAPEEAPGPTAEERAKTLEHRQKALAKRMRKKRQHLYAGKRYTPALTAPTTPATTQAPKADRVVVPMRLTKSK